MRSEKYYKLVNIIKKKTHRYREQTSGDPWGEEGGRGKKRGGDKEVQTIRYKISYTYILCNMGNIANIL